ncbi:hypothetical protein G1C95_1671 [Bifidobacterium sp. DSM 109957]|uniref:Uncharacterized protein n=1 Tax=Bifidobacterium oedipodis TaxID=2675322 RepID=A0A7Y0EQC1_9BIFI|nr:hypothetical protein [Bifidobacterium sp. DSM 109957]
MPDALVLTFRALGRVRAALLVVGGGDCGIVQACLVYEDLNAALSIHVKERNGRKAVVLLYSPVILLHAYVRISQANRAGRQANRADW